jgi:MFS family permease
LIFAYDYPASAWGFLSAINPLLVVLCQGALTRRVAHIGAGLRIGAGTLLMGLPWLLLLVDHGIPIIVAVIVLFVLGEMLWAPASQALAADLAPDHSRGAYQGAYGATMSVALAIGPLVSLYMLDSRGVSPMWIMLAGTGVVATAASWIALRVRPQPADAVASTAQ